MKKTSLFKSIFVMMAMALSGTAMAQPSGQYAIGDQGMQTATNVKALPDGSGNIVAGYEYRLDGSGNIESSMIIVLKVNPASNTIIWQRRVGIPGTTNLVYNMMLTHDNNVVIVGTVGRDAVYSGNSATIMKFRSSDGLRLWENTLQDPAMTTGGEVFYGVTELGAAGHYDIVAVGAHDNSPGGSDAMICVFDQFGSFKYEEDWGVPNSDGYASACTAPNGVDVYLCGQYRGSDYHDIRIDHYTPNTTSSSGTINWARQFNYSLPGVSLANDTVTAGSLALSNNFTTNIYHTGSELIIHGGSLNAFTFTGGHGESIMRMRDDGTGVVELWQIQNGGLTYANTSKIAVVNRDRLFNVQMPASSWIDPINWLTGTAVDAVVTEVTSLTGTGTGVGGHSTIKKPMKFTTPQGGAHSLYDIDLANSNSRLVMAGCTNDKKGQGANDIYLVTSPTTPTTSKWSTPKHGCDEENSGGCVQVKISSVSTTYKPAHFSPNFLTTTPDDLQYKIVPLCQPTIKCADSSDLAVVTSVNADGNCVFTVTASVTTPGTVKGYEWTLPDGSVMQVLTSTTSNTQVFTIASGAPAVVSVRILIISDYWDEGGSPCCDIKLQKQLFCDQKPCNGIRPPFITATTMHDAFGNCEPAYTSNVYPVTLDFMANVSSASPYWTCGAFPGSKVLAGPGPEVISPCDIPVGAWSAAACTPPTPYPCPLSAGTTVHINYMVAYKVTYMGCPFNINVPIDPVCPPAKPSGDGAAKTSAKLNVAPNPTDGILELTGTTGEATDKEVSIEITDMLGKSIMTERCMANKGKIIKKITLDNNVANGMYLIKVSGGKLSETVRFTVNR